MTKKKLVLLKHKRMWEPVVTILVNLLVQEPPRTNGKGRRAKIRLRLHKDFKHVKKWPKSVFVHCDDVEYIIRELRACTLLDHLHELGISKWSSHDIYRMRMGAMSGVKDFENFLDMGVDGL
jgi:hypothetical protein